MKKLNTVQELADLPNGSVVILGVDRTDVHPGVIQRQDDGQWYAVAYPYPISVNDILAESFPVGVPHTGDTSIESKPVFEDDTAGLDELLALLAAKGE